MAHEISFPPRDQSVDFLLALNAKYKAAPDDGGLGRPVGATLPLPGHGDVELHVDLEGIFVWLPEYLRCRANGYNHLDAVAEVSAQIDDVIDPAHAPHARPPKPQPAPGPPTPPSPPPSVPLDHPEVTFKNYLLQADAADPQAKIQNTEASCGRLLHAALKIAQAARPGEFAFIGKAAGKDGAKFIPNNFVPFTAPLKRPDGQTEVVAIDGVGMDAVWYLPTGVQIKAIANSSANDNPDPKIHGPAQLTPYLIDKFHKDTGALQYRWHNPPVSPVTLTLVG